MKTIAACEMEKQRPAESHRFGSLLLLLLFCSSCDSRPPKLALGALERDRVAHAAAASEVIIALPAAQGSIVKQGDILARLDDTLQQAQVRRAEAELAQAAAQLDKLRNGAQAEEIAAATAKVAGAKAVLAESESQHERLRGLLTQRISSKGELDKALAARDVARSNLNVAQEELRLLLKGSREEDLRAATAKLDAAAAVLAIERKKLADLTVTAACDGILDDLPWHVGERPAAGTPLAVVLAGNAPYARVYLPEPYRVKIKMGDTLTVHIDGLDVPISGQVRWIAAEPAFTPYYALNQEERARLMYLTEVQLPDSAAQLPAGLPAQVDLP
ncbi:HlyD family secretion protein [Candidatus Electronema sp. JC]|uniref:HlyD family secretion protein n=1 Tax=Candidatus Electronema sp. JC TaxID=3401570 RepID=UPI003AA8A315